jgi:hypothetical protein
MLPLLYFSLAAGSILRRHKQPEGFDPKGLLCSPGGKEQSWCSDWLTCIKEKSVPDGKSKVMEAWDPAPCEEVCGKWPTTTPPGLLQVFKASGANEPDNCIPSCTKFQESLSSCVGTVLFEPGQMATMGGGSSDPEPKMSENCKASNSTCLPDLPVKYQECISNKAKVVLKRADEHDHCAQVIEDYDECRNCPQLKGSFASQFHTFIGGCMDQLHAYHQATMPSQGEAAIPGAKGCKVHG